MHDQIATEKDITGASRTMEASTIRHAEKSQLETQLQGELDTVTPSSKQGRNIQFLDSGIKEYPEERILCSSGIYRVDKQDDAHCSLPRTHFVTQFRLSDLCDYNVSLAQHMSSDDYCYMITAIQVFLRKQSNASRNMRKVLGSQSSQAGSNSCTSVQSSKAESQAEEWWGNFVFGAAEPLQMANQEATILNELLADISRELQARKVPIMICVAAFPLFIPQNISDAHVHILHVPFVNDGINAPDTSITPPKQARGGCRLSFIDCEWLDRTDSLHSSDQSRNPKLDAQNQSDKVQAIRSSSTFKRFEYLESTGFAKFTLKAILSGDRRPSDLCSQSAINRARYEHNLHLEHERNLSNGSRLRLVRFGFRNSLVPLHTPEMAALGLASEDYTRITTRFLNINANLCPPQCPFVRLLRCFRTIRKRITENTWTRLYAYVRELNSEQNRIVWTIEKIPGVIDRGFVRDKAEYEISAWRAEDAWELLKELERWGLVKSSLCLGEDV